MNRSPGVPESIRPSACSRNLRNALEDSSPAVEVRYMSGDGTAICDGRSAPKMVASDNAHNSSPMMMSHVPPCFFPVAATTLYRLPSLNRTSFRPYA